MELYYEWVVNKVESVINLPSVNNLIISVVATSVKNRYEVLHFH